MKDGMKLLLISFFIFINCQNTNFSTTLIDIDVLQISYELTYEESHSLKVIIKTINDLDFPVSFPAKLKALKSNEDFNLKCQNVSVTEIECYTEKDVIFDLKAKYYFYYNRGENGLYTMEEQSIYKDFKQVSLIFKPEMYNDLVMYRDHRKVIGLNDKKIVGGGYLYLVRNSKKLLHKPKDGFNKIIELNNFIIHEGITDKIPPCSLASYKEAINRGYRIVDANIQFTKDKIPIVCSQTNFEIISSQKRKINNMTLQELNDINIGLKYEQKYKDEKLLLLEDLLKLCQENNALIDFFLSDLDYKNIFENNNEFAKIIIDTINKYNMIDSVIFEEGSNNNIITRLLEIKNDISISIGNINSKEDMDKMKDKYPNSKRIIFSLSNNNQIDEKIIQYGLSLGKKIKVSIIDDISLAKKFFSKGVNFITTNKLEPFLVENEYEEPILLKCTQFDVLVDCRLGQEVKLYDNAVYNIYYTTNIYKLYEDIDNKPIGYFKYYDTKQLDDRFYKIHKFDFETGDIDLNITFAIKKGKKLKGKVGPNYDNVKDCYLYDFVCEGNNLLNIHCKINKDERVIKFDGNYSIHMVNYYSFNNSLPNAKIPNTVFDLTKYRKEHKFYYFSSIVFIICASIILLYVFRENKNKNSFIKIKIEQKPIKDN